VRCARAVEHQPLQRARGAWDTRALPRPEGGVIHETLQRALRAGTLNVRALLTLEDGAGVLRAPRALGRSSRALPSFEDGAGVFREKLQRASPVLDV
jgi:hypothetical protein